MHNVSGRSGIRHDAPTRRRHRQLLFRQSTLARHRHRPVWLRGWRTDPTTFGGCRHCHVRLQSRGEAWCVPYAARRRCWTELQTFACTQQRSPVGQGADSHGQKCSKSQEDNLGSRTTPTPAVSYISCQQIQFGRQTHAYIFEYETNKGVVSHSQLFVCCLFTPIHFSIKISFFLSWQKATICNIRHIHI